MYHGELAKGGLVAGVDREARDMAWIQDEPEEHACGYVSEGRVLVTHSRNRRLQNETCDSGCWLSWTA